MNEQPANEDCDIELGLQGQSNWHGKQIEGIAFLDSKQGAEKHIRNPEVTGCAYIIAVMGEDRELRDAIRESDIDDFVTEYVTDKIVDFVADTGRRIFGRTASTRQVPDDIEAARDLLA
ncbi:hypothetical protein PRZ48_012653 [Zasmidium cellare]|uniref:Uncharacterized protein n=1 Tax=Zasmidium cellare TaxID=395010 RepID=A0ABR0E614_ZASCE|nr:hypothetical protein PRZ48_012653 [Zasmidium cellare]